MSINLFSLGHDLAAHLKARASNRPSVKHANLFRVRLLGWLALLVFFALTYRLLLVSVPRTFSFSLFPNWTESGPKAFTSRSDLLDRHGEILATNIPIYHFAIRPKQIEHKDAFIDKVLPFISGISRSNLYKKVHSSKKYVYVKKKVSDKVRKKLLALKDPAVEFEKIDLRAYPKKNILAHLVGFTGTENKGLKGLEYGLDDLIRKDPEQQIKLACDSRFQEIIYIALKEGIEKYSAKGGGAILMKADTGEILSLISMPDFDPNAVSKSPVSNRFNKMISGVYEPGSVFKLFNTAMAIEEGLENKWYDVQKPLKVGRFRINDLHKMEEKKAQLDQILIHSSNIGSGQMAWDIGAKKQKSYLEKFGFFGRLNTQLGKTARPLLPAKWDKAEMATMSYGHGISVTPLQVLAAANALVNGGYYLEPTFTPIDTQSFKAVPVISESTSAKMRTLMYRVVEEGTGQKVKIEGLKIGGKTGTSEKNINGRYEKDKVVNWFVASFPIENPSYTLLVMIDEPKGRKEDWNLKTSAWNAVPITKQILQNILPFLDIDLKKKKVEEKNETK